MPKTFVGLMLVSGLLSGCGFADFVRVSLNAPLTANDVAFIAPYQTTFTELVAKLGTPDELVESSEGVIAIYHFLDARYSRINYGLAASAWSPVTPDLISEGLGMGFDRLEVQLDRTWRVHHVGFAHQHDRLPGFNLWPFADQKKSESK